LVKSFLRHKKLSIITGLLKKVECTTIMTTRWLENRMSLFRDKYETLQAIVLLSPYHFGMM